MTGHTQRRLAALATASFALGAGSVSGAPSPASADVTANPPPVQGNPAKVPTYRRGFPGARLSRRTAGVTFDGTAFVRVDCPKFVFGFCYGSITLSRGATRVGSAPFGVRTRDAPAVRVPLSSSARRAARRGGLRVTARIVSEDGLGRRVTRRQSLTLRRG